MTNPPAGTVRLNINITTELHRKFKTACAQTGKPMTDVLLELVQEYVDEHPSDTSPGKGKKKK